MTHGASADGGTPSLKETFGDLVELSGDGGGTAAYRILAEIEIGGLRYAVLQSEAMVKEGDIEIFRIAADPGRSLQLETVEDDEEWERAAEAYDDLQFGNDERP